MLGKLSILGRNRETYVVKSYHTFIGSHSKCDIRIYGPGISPQHCVVSTQGDSSATIRNLPHNRTTLVNDCDIGMSDYSLSHNDIIKIGNTKLMWSKADGKKSSSKDSSGRLVAVVMPQKRSSDEFSNSSSKKIKLGDTSLAHSSSLSPFSDEWEKRSQKRSLVHSTPAVRRQSRTESFRLLTSNFFDDSSLLVESTFEERKNMSPKSSVKKVCFTSKKVPRKALLDSSAQKSILKKPMDISTPTNVRRTKELNFRSPRNSSLRAIIASSNSTPVRPLHRQILTEPRRVLSRTNLSSQIDALCLEKSLLAAKKLKSEPPKLMDKKKLAALLVCHKKKSPRKDEITTPQPKRKSELDNLFIDMKFSTEKPKKQITKSSSSPSILQTSKTLGVLRNSPSVENMSLSLSNENLNEKSVSQKLSKSKNRALSQLNIDMKDSRSPKHENDENSTKKPRRSKSLESMSTRKTTFDEKDTKNLSKSMGVLIRRLHIDMNDFPSGGRKRMKSMGVSKKEENKKLRSKSVGSKPTIVLPSRALSRLSIDMNDSPKSPERAKKDLSASLSSPKSKNGEKKHKPTMIRAENNLPSLSPDIPQIPDLNLSLGIAKNVARILSPLKYKAKRMSAELPQDMQEHEKATRMSAASPSSQESSPLTDVQEDDLLNALHLSRKSAIVQKPKQPVRRLRSSIKNLNGIQQLFSSEYKHYSKEEVKKLFDDDTKPTTSVGEMKRKLYSPIPDPKINSMDRVFTTSPVVDYTDTCGVKRLFTISPKADYSDPLGIKELFAVSKTNYLDVSGDLFNQARTSGSNKRKSVLVKKTEKRPSLAKPQKEDALKDRLEKKLLKKSVDVESTAKSTKRVKKPRKSATPPTRTLRSRAAKTVSPQKSEAKKGARTKAAEKPAKEVNTKKRGAKEVSSSEKEMKKRASNETSPAKEPVKKRMKKVSISAKEATKVVELAEKTKKRTAKKAASPPKVKAAKEVKTKKKAANKTSSPAKDEAAGEVKTKKRAAKKASSPAKEDAKEVKPKKRAAKKASIPAKDDAEEVKPKKRAAKKASSPAKDDAEEVKPKKRAAKKASSPAKEDAKEVKPKKRAAKKASSPAKDAEEVKTKKRGAKKSLSPAKDDAAKEVKTKKRAAKRASSPAKEDAKEVKPKKRAAKKASSPSKDDKGASTSAKTEKTPSPQEVKTKKRALKKVSSPAKVDEAASSSAKKTKKAPNQQKEVKKRATKNEQASSPNVKTTKTKKVASAEKEVKGKKTKSPKVAKTSKNETKPASEGNPEPSTSRSTTKKTKKLDPAKKPSPAKSTKSKPSPKKSSAKKPKLIVKITPPKILGSILKKPRGRPASVSKKVLFDQSPSPKKKTKK